MEDVEYSPIGVIRTPFSDSRGMPKGAGARDARGTVEVFERYAGGLADLEGFSHVVLVWHMHLSDGPLLMVRPWNERRHRGVFSTRSPRRPNPIGITLVRLVRVEGRILHVRGVDMAEGTPLLDIKPYLPEEDRAGRVRTGWFGRRKARLDVRGTTRRVRSLRKHGR
jgi:tRNA-Thr(GGU) m(6)t(6)A37 methyltransferase TsaA